MPLWQLGLLSIQPKSLEISVGTSNGAVHFGLVQPEYLGPALKVVHFDRSGYFGQSGRSVPFHLTKLLSPFPLFYILLTKNSSQMRGGLGQICATGMYHSIGYLKFLKFLTGIFVEWKVP